MKSRDILSDALTRYDKEFNQAERSFGWRDSPRIYTNEPPIRETCILIPNTTKVPRKSQKQKCVDEEVEQKSMADENWQDQDRKNSTKQSLR